MWTLYDLHRGTLHTMTDAEAEKTIKFYRLFENHLGQWQSGNGRFYLWKNDEQIKEQKNE